MASFVALVQRARAFEWLLFGYSEIFRDNATRMGKARRTNKWGFKCLETKNVYDYNFRWIRGDGWNRL